uniref:Uncharacterized protein n=1 Tax=Timema poppense TaxID=170557 RepID=A0A7R9D443_TIMPO|nr:unnamed protein product [Timema poppensis]
MHNQSGVIVCQCVANRELVCQCIATVELSLPMCSHSGATVCQCIANISYSLPMCSQSGATLCQCVAYLELQSANMYPIWSYGLPICSQSGAMVCQCVANPELQTVNVLPIWSYSLPMYSHCGAQSVNGLAQLVLRLTPGQGGERGSQRDKHILKRSPPDSLTYCVTQHELKQLAHHIPVKRVIHSSLVARWKVACLGELSGSVACLGELSGSVVCLGELLASVACLGELSRSVVCLGELSRSVVCLGELSRSVVCLGELSRSVACLEKLLVSVVCLGELSGSVACLGELSGSVVCLGELLVSVACLGELSGSVVCLGELLVSVACLGEFSGSVVCLGELSGSVACLGELSGSVACLGELSGSVACLGELVSQQSKLILSANRKKPSWLAESNRNGSASDRNNWAEQSVKFVVYKEELNKDGWCAHIRPLECCQRHLPSKLIVEWKRVKSEELTTELAGIGTPKRVAMSGAISACLTSLRLTWASSHERGLGGSVSVARRGPLIPAPHATSACPTRQDRTWQSEGTTPLDQTPKYLEHSSCSGQRNLQLLDHTSLSIHDLQWPLEDPVKSIPEMTFISRWFHEEGASKMINDKLIDMGGQSGHQAKGPRFYSYIELRRRVVIFLETGEAVLECAIKSSFGLATVALNSNKTSSVIDSKIVKQSLAGSQALKMDLLLYVVKTDTFLLFNKKNRQAFQQNTQIENCTKNATRLTSVQACGLPTCREPSVSFSGHSLLYCGERTAGSVGILAQMEQQCFSFLLCAMDLIPGLTHSLSQQLQSQNLDLMEVGCLIKSTKEELVRIRSDDKYEELLEKAKSLANNSNIEWAVTKNTKDCDVTSSR